MEAEPRERAQVPASEKGRGRHADKPSDVPARGWRDILLRTKAEITDDHLSIIAAGVAFYCFTAFVPALGAVVSVYALVLDPAQVSEHIAAMGRILPQEVMPLLREQLERLTAADHKAGFGAAIGFLLALYSSAKATGALIDGLNICYDEKERRGFVRLQAISLTMTLAAVAGAVLALGLIAVVPSLVDFLRLPPSIQLVAEALRWPVLLGGFVTALAIAYRFGPSRDAARWRWVSWGAAVATVLWLITSLGFSWYASSFGSYDKTYGSLGALVVFLLWLYLSVFVVLIGAELNAEMERQTVRDTTTGPEKPMGQRGAYPADTVGPAPP